METPIVRIIVVDDYEPFRRFVCSMLEQRPELRVVGEASDGLEAVQKAEELQPDLILLDIGLPALNGMEAARRIRKLAPHSKILFVSMESSPEVVQEALNLGAHGYVLKSRAGSELLAAVEALIEGKQFVSSALPDHVLTSAQTPDQFYSEDVPALNAPVTQRPKIVRHHAVQLYSGDESFLNDFTRFITGALYAQRVVIVVATESHRVRLLRSLRAGGVDVAAAVGQKRYFALDVPDSLPKRTVDGLCNPVRFARVVVDLIAEAAKAAKGKHTHVAVG
jgi:DNA-binding NarL/FixJ family response regulator